MNWVEERCIATEVKRECIPDAGCQWTESHHQNPSHCVRDTCDNYKVNVDGICDGIIDFNGYVLPNWATMCKPENGSTEGSSCVDIVPCDDINKQNFGDKYGEVCNLSFAFNKECEMFNLVTGADSFLPTCSFSGTQAKCHGRSEKGCLTADEINDSSLYCQWDRKQASINPSEACITPECTDLESLYPIFFEGICGAREDCHMTSVGPKTPKPQCVSHSSPPTCADYDNQKDACNAVPKDGRDRIGTCGCDWIEGSNKCQEKTNCCRSVKWDSGLLSDEDAKETCESFDDGGCGCFWNDGFLFTNSSSWIPGMNDLSLGCRPMFTEVNHPPETVVCADLDDHEIACNLTCHCEYWGGNDGCVKKTTCSDLDHDACDKANCLGPCGCEWKGGDDGVCEAAVGCPDCNPECHAYCKECDTQVGEDDSCPNDCIFGGNGQTCAYWCNELDATTCLDSRCQLDGDKCIPAEDAGDSSTGDESTGDESTASTAEESTASTEETPDNGIARFISVSLVTALALIM